MRGGVARQDGGVRLNTGEMIDELNEDGEYRHLGVSQVFGVKLALTKVGSESIPEYNRIQLLLPM